MVDDVAAALEVATTARDEDLGTIDIAVADAPAPTTTPAVIGGATFARDVVTAPDGILGVLSRVMIVDDLAAARAALTAEGASEVIFVTRAGRSSRPSPCARGPGLAGLDWNWRLSGTAPAPG